LTTNRILETVEFGEWLRGIVDVRTRATIHVRLRRLSLGNPGDVRPVGEAVSELRIAIGPGYRVYYTRVGDRTWLILLGGSKATQQRDIRRAKALARIFEQER